MAVSAHAAVPKFDDRSLIEPQLSQHSERRWKPFSAIAVGGWVAMLAVCVGAGWLITGALSDSGLVRWDRQFPVDLAATRTATGRMWSR